MTNKTPNNYRVIQVRKNTRTEEQRAAHSKRMKELWSDPEWKAEKIKVYQKPEIKEQRRKELTERWADPEYKAKTRKAQSQGAKNRWADPAERKRQSERIKAARAKKNGGQ